MVAGGSGRRFGAPKQFLELAGRPVVEWSVRTARSVADGVVVVLPGPEGDAADDREVPTRPPSWVADADRVVGGGSTRAASVRAGLAAVPEQAAVVVVHDAVRPLASPALFESVVAAVRLGADAAVPVVPVGDTLKRVAEDGTVGSTVDRAGLVAVQTPQAFEAGALRRAHAAEPEATDDAGLLELAGATVRTVAGEPWNLKITEPGDFEVVESLVGLSPRRLDG